jgi:hypothetical protein
MVTANILVNQVRAFPSFVYFVDHCYMHCRSLDLTSSAALSSMSGILNVLGRECINRLKIVFIRFKPHRKSMASKTMSILNIL